MWEYVLGYIVLSIFTLILFSRLPKNKYDRFEDDESQVEFIKKSNEKKAEKNQNNS